MKSLWNLVSFLAVVHLLALVMVLAWLWQSDRLNGARVQTVRELLARTISEVEREEEDREREEQARLAAEEEEARRRNPPVTSATQIQLVSQIEQQADLNLRRMADEQRQLLAQIEEATAALEQARAEFEAEKQAWYAATEAERMRRTDEQFAKAVRLLESIPAKQGKTKIEELVTTGRVEQAVAYLNSMNPRAAAAIMREFKTPPENQLATELLERLRTFGLKVEPREERSDADPDPGAS